MRTDEGPVTDQELVELGEATHRYATDDFHVRSCGTVGMGFQGYHTHARSRVDKQPAVDVQGNLLVFDGRLDNHKELSALLESPQRELTDSQIVLAAFAKWGEGCFARLIGDWALALWAAASRSLYLSRDHAGVRTLYYRIADQGVQWSTFPETLLIDSREESVDESFLAFYLANEPLRDLTPYRDMRAVTPAHYMRFRRRDDVSKKAHWDWMRNERIVYSRDDLYDEHFLSLFRQSVQRRTGAEEPVLAQLSGGVDSTAIVCMADIIREEQGTPPQQFVDSVSYYDDSEPNWNETPYFLAVERKRGKAGTHVRTSALDRSFLPPPLEYPFPGADSRSLESELRFGEQVSPLRYRAIVSGLGGDELLGGPPNPRPELGDYLVSGRVGAFLRQSFQWSLSGRAPLATTIAGAAWYTAGLYPRLPAMPKPLPPWMSNHLRSQYIKLKSEQDRPSTIGLLPTTIDNGSTWWSMLETLVHRFHSATVRREYRYPYLDRDLVEFLHAVPAHQLSKPGRRRLLMRRALRNIVPSEVLERRRKAYVSRGPMKMLSDNRDAILLLFDKSKLAESGYIDLAKFRTALDGMNSQSPSEWRPAKVRTINLELWLQRASVTAATN